MTRTYTSTALAVIWALAMFAIGVLLGTSSVIGWAIVAAFALLPPLLLARWWRDDPNVSESIHKALH